MGVWTVRRGLRISRHWGGGRFRQREGEGLWEVGLEHLSDSKEAGGQWTRKGVLGEGGRFGQGKGRRVQGRLTVRHREDMASPARKGDLGRA